MQTETENTTSKAREQAGEVAGTAKEEAKGVAREASQQARESVRNLQGDIRSRANEQATKVSQTLRDTSRQLHSMADSSSESNNVMSSLVREGANAADRLAGRLDQGGVEAVMADVRAWGRRNPGTFLLGAATLGFITGRIVRNMSSDGGNGHTTKQFASNVQGRTSAGLTPGTTGTTPGTSTEFTPAPGSPAGMTFEDEGPAL
jgi:uncharacterized protein YjbJ (UPF0337 family)